MIWEIYKKQTKKTKILGKVLSVCHLSQRSSRTNSLFSLNQTHGVNHNICGPWNPRRRCPVVPLSLGLQRESKLQDVFCVLNSSLVLLRLAAKLSEASSVYRHWKTDSKIKNIKTKTLGKVLKICQEKHSHTAAHHPVVKPPSVYSTAVSHTPTQQQGWGNQ